jgi:vesicle-associated membrane protein 7
MTGLLYSFVARDTTVLAEYSAIQGNFRTVAQECLLNAKISDERFTITSDAYTFNFLVSNGFTFLVVADEAYGRQIPFAFLERLRDAFVEKFGDKGRTAAEDSLNNTFSPTIQKQLQYCMEHPEEISKMAQVQRKVDEVKGIMMQNVEQVLVRGERLDVLVDRTDDLRDQAQQFQRQGTRLRKRMWWQNFRMKIIVAAVVVLLVVVIFLLACFSGGRNCTKRGGGAPAPPGGSNLNAADGTVPAGVTLPAATSGLVPASAPRTAAAPASGATLPASTSALVPASAPAPGGAPTGITLAPSTSALVPAAPPAASGAAAPTGVTLPPQPPSGLVPSSGTNP